MPTSTFSTHDHGHHALLDMQDVNGNKASSRCSGQWQTKLVYQHRSQIARQTDRQTSLEELIATVRTYGGPDTCTWFPTSKSH